MVASPVLSVLIPAYNHAEGVARILKNQGPDTGKVEYIVRDDSSTDAVAKLMSQRKSRNVTFRRNPNRGEPAENWNGLLNSAKGTFVVLVHHDEFPAQAGMFEKLADHLQTAQSNAADIYLLSFRRLRGNAPVSNKLVPDFVRFWLARNLPSYLSRRNFVGPTATFVVRRDICPRFDARLTWLVDVDFYRRSLNQARQVQGLAQFCIVSEIDRQHSITQRIKASISAIRRQDLSLIANRDNVQPVENDNIVWSVFEVVFWSVARLAGRFAFGKRYDG